MADPTPIVEAFSLSHAQICDGTSTFLESLADAVAQGLDIYGVNDASLAADTGNYDNNGDDTTLSRWNWINFATVTVQGGYLSLPLYATMSEQPLTTTTITPVNEVQTIPSSGASAGTFTLSYKGAVTAPIAYNAANTVVQSALQALATVGSGNLVVTGGPANTTALVVTAAGTLAGQPLDLLTIDLTGLTGAETVVIARTTAGVKAGVNYGADLWHEDSMNTSPKPMILQMPSKDHLGQVRRLIYGLYRVQFGPIGFDGPTYKEGMKVNYEGTALMSTVNEAGVAFPDGKKRIGRLLSIA